jgi:hypothetical protein
MIRPANVANPIKIKGVVTLAQCSQTKPYLPQLQWHTAKVKVTDLYLLTVPTSQYAEVC